MKRWNSISAAAVMSVSAIALSACDEPKVDAEIFSSLQQCTDNPDLTREQCEQGYKEARSQHAEVAPKYTSKAKTHEMYRKLKFPYDEQSSDAFLVNLFFNL